jgi:hypothetical protein
MSIIEVTMRRLSFAFAAVAAVALSAGCYPDRSVSSAAQLDLVLTQVNPNSVFRGVATYSLADSIVHLIPEGSEDTLSRAYDQLILNTVKSNLDGLGWTEVANTQDNPPDVAVEVSAIATENYAWISYPWFPYWGWYWPWYPGYAPIYPPTTIVYNYKTGTLIMDMIDAKNPDTPGQKLKIMWTGALNGVLETGNASARLTSGINQAFTQSPYLKP